MISLYVIRDAQTGYTGDLVQAHSDGELIAMLQPMATQLNRDDPVIRSMIANSQVWQVGTYDPDHLLLESCDRRLVRSLADIPLLPVPGDEEDDEDA